MVSINHLLGIVPLNAPLSWYDIVVILQTVHDNPPPIPPLFIPNILPLFSSSSLVKLTDISEMSNSPLCSSYSHLICSVWSDTFALI